MKFSSFLIAAVMAATAIKAGAQNPIPLSAEPFPLEQVRLLDGPFRDAMSRDEDYLLSLDTDRLTRNFRINSGLSSNAKAYGGWEAPDCQLRGHAVGHYLSACAHMYVSTGDERFKQRVDAIVAQFAECQSNAVAAGFHPGYLSAFPESFMDRLDAGKPVWAPWYTLHKIMAGLFDANQLCGNQQALNVLTNMADWVGFRVDRLSPAQMQRTLEVEQGGMTEVLANLYGVTGNTNYLRLAEAFNQQRLLTPLEQGSDQLNGLHANTQIPKIIGLTREYEFDRNPQFLTAANTFWTAVAMNRSYAIGGDSDHEHFFPENQFDRHLSPETCETCNTYNMLKLTRELFTLEPDATKMDFYERALYNDILASQDPDSDMFTYFMSLKPGHFKVYSTPEDSFWCCVGTGMENHAKYGESIYFHDASTLYVNLFIASELKWPEQGLVARQVTRFPEADTSELKFKLEQPKTFAVKIRYPGWAQDGIKIKINGKKHSIQSSPGSYLTIDRQWQDGDTVQITIPMRLHMEFLPGNTNQFALLYGPVVLAGKLGTTNLPVPLANTQNQFNNVPDPAVPAFVCSPDKVLSHVEPVRGKTLQFLASRVTQPQSITLAPFYQIHRERYSVYWKLMSESQWRDQAAGFAAAEARRMAEEARVVDVVRPGEQQSETDHQMHAEGSQTGDSYGFKWRQATGWFSYVVKVLPGQSQQLEISIQNRTNLADFELLVDGTPVSATANPLNKSQALVALPPEITKDKQNITIKFVAHPGKTIGGISGIRVLRST